MQHDLFGSPVAQDYGKAIGAPFKVLLSSGVKQSIDAKTGKLITDIIDLPGLIASVLQSRVLHPRKLSGDDLKFIRSALRMRSVDFAEALEISPEHYSRCESGTKTLSSSSEKFLRMYVFLQTICRNAAFQEFKKNSENIDCKNPEEAKEAIDAFQRVFFEMKIQHIYDVNDELEFSFSWNLRRGDEQIADRGNEDGKWQKEPEAKAA